MDTGEAFGAGFVWRIVYIPLFDRRLKNSIR